MSDSNIELESGLIRKREERENSLWTLFSMKTDDQPRDNPQIDRDLRLRMLDAVALNSLAESTASTKAGLNAYVDNLLVQFEDTERIFHCLIPASFRPGSDNRESNWFAQIFLVIWEAARQLGRVSLNTLMETLQKGDHLESFRQAQTQQKDKLTLRLVFFLVGCSTKLYTFQSRPLSLDTFQINRCDARTDYCYTSYLKTQVSDDGTQRPVRDLLQEFGRIPLRAIRTMQDIPESQAKEIIDPIDFNAKILRNTCGIKILWTDILSAHLDYDERSKSLFLFMFPSFCLANIPASAANNHVNIVQRCWTEASRPSMSASQEMANYMKEVLLTTHLIFSQVKKPRRFFQLSDASTDPLLAILCGHDWPAIFQDWNHLPRRVYDIYDDFPIFGKKLRTINNQIVLARPKGIKELWKDDRDTLQWYTFWAVVIIGGFGLVLSLCQTALVAVQVWAIFRVKA